MFPAYILSTRCPEGKYITLWQLDHYHYEIEHTGGRTIDLPDTPYEDAVRALQRHIEKLQLLAVA